MRYFLSYSSAIKTLTLTYVTVKENTTNTQVNG